MFFYFKSISLNSSALTGKSNTAADLHSQAALLLNYTPEKNCIPLAFIPTCSYIELFLFVLPPQIWMRKAWIIVAFQATMMNIISVQNILHEFTRGFYFWAHICSAKLSFQTAHRVLLSGSFHFFVWLFTILGGVVGRY